MYATKDSSRDFLLFSIYIHLIYTSHYYYHSETKERQWRRPDNNSSRQSLRLAGTPIKDDRAGEEIQRHHRTSLRLSSSPQLQQQQQQGQQQTPEYLTEEQGGTLTTAAAAKVSLARKISTRVLEADEVDEDKKNTISYMCRIGTVHKRGFLMKQGKFIGRYEIQ